MSAPVHADFISYSAPVEQQRIAMIVSISLSVCLSVTIRPNIVKFLMHVTEGSGSIFFSGGVPIRYVLPVLRMTSQQRVSYAAASLQRRARADDPAV